MRIACDTQVFHFVAGDSAFQALVQAVKDRGLATFTTCRITVDELDAAPAAKDIGQRSALPHEVTGAGVFVLDHSLLDVDRLGTDEANAAYTHIQNDSPNHVNDAIIFATAVADADYFVTNDNRLFKRATDLNLSRPVVLRPAQMKEMLENLLSRP